MKALIFQKTGRKHILTHDITIFSNIETDSRDNCDTIILDDVKTKHCAIIKDEDRFKIIDLCSFDTRQLIKDETQSCILKPLKSYELRDNDKIFIGKNEIVFREELDVVKKEKLSFYVPETQSDILIKSDSFETPEHIEIPATQDFDTQVLIDEENLAREELKDVNNDEKNQFLVKTQPLLNVVPIFTRARSLKQAQLKPKTLPIAVFDCNTQDKEVNTCTQMTSANGNNKRRAQFGKLDLKRKTNSILLSEEDESDCDDHSRTSVKADITVRRVSLSEDISLEDHLEIPSPIFNSPFLAQINESCSNENLSSVLNTEIGKRNVETIEKEKELKITGFQNYHDFPPRRRKKFKLFKFTYSDDDD